MIKILLSIALLCIGVTAATADAAQELTGQSLVTALRQGGYAIYFRHAATDWSLSDNISAVGQWKSCDRNKMRQLSEQGRADSRNIGRAIKALKIPVTSILSSEYCRAFETARLFDLGKVQTTRDIMNLRAANYVGGRKAVIQRFRQLLARPIPAGGNVILAGHGNLVRDATGVYPAEGGSVIFTAEPGADHGFRVVGKLTSEDWIILAKDFAGTH